METYIYLIVALFIATGLAIIYEFFLPRKSPDTFPDDDFSETCKKYNTKEIAESLDEIGDGI